MIKFKEKVKEKEKKIDITFVYVVQCIQIWIRINI